MTELEPNGKIGNFIGLSICLPSADELLENHTKMTKKYPKAKAAQVKIEIAGEIEKMTFHELERRLKK